MRQFDEIVRCAVAAPRTITVQEMVQLLASEDPNLEASLFAAAHEIKERCGKTEVLPRGLIETSNICQKNCLYCGIRRDNDAVLRYRLSETDVLMCIEEAKRRGWKAVAFQAGEIESEANTAFYEKLLKECADDLEVTLSLGEQTEETYRRWKSAAGSRILRYLIRIETSNRELYAQLHPTDHSFDRRLACIRTLKRLGYVTGSGVMIGLPGQTIEDLANDIVFFGRENLDMVGMGPYVPNGDTPLGQSRIENKEYRMRLALRMIALTRLYLHNINIVSATALEALSPAEGREKGIEAGANVVMTDLTPTDAKTLYALYPGKVMAR